MLELRNKIICNAQAVTTTLGGGRYGHLGLVMNVTTYNALPDAQPCLRPNFSSAFALSNNNLTDAEIVIEKAQWDEAMRLWRWVEGVERALVQQIVAVVEPKYLNGLRNPVTTKIKSDIKSILNHLFNNRKTKN